MMKKIHVITSTITLAILMILLVFSLFSKKALDEAMTETINSIIPDISLNEKDSNSNSWFQDIFENEEVKEFMKDYETSEEFEKIKEKWNETKESSKEKFESAKKEYEEMFNQLIEEQEQYLSPEQQMLINIVKAITNVKIKWLLFVLIVINLVIIAFTEKSFHKWIKSLAWALFLSGIGVIVICYFVKKYLLSFITTTITLKALIDPAIMMIVAGVIIRILYLIAEIIIKINKKVDKEEKIDEISEVSEE